MYRKRAHGRCQQPAANGCLPARTPLNSIIGLTRLLAEPAPDGTTLDPERRYQVELIRNSGSTLLALVNDLLDVAKAESGRLHVDPAQVNLPALFGRLRGLARPMAEGKPVEVIVSDDGLPEEILTDEVALTGILRNLLSNGIKYTDRGALLARLPAVIITGADGPAPPRAAALLRKDELTPERLEFTIRGVLREAA
jgi:signal transduction histidine kinase